MKKVLKKIWTVLKRLQIIGIIGWGVIGYGAFCDHAIDRFENDGELNVFGILMDFIKKACNGYKRLSEMFIQIGRGY